LCPVSRKSSTQNLSASPEHLHESPDRQNAAAIVNTAAASAINATPPVIIPFVESIVVPPFSVIAAAISYQATPFSVIEIALDQYKVAAKA
jgi:hypothetical protein